MRYKRMRQFLSFLAFGLSLGLESTTKLPRSTPKATELLQFPDGARLENLKVLPNGHLIITTLSSSDVFTVDPYANPPKPNKLVSLPGGSALLGITLLNRGLYAVVSAIPSSAPNRFVPGSYKIHIIFPLAHGKANPLIDTISILKYEFLNGLTTLPKKPHVILAADSFAGEILRIDTHTHQLTTAFASPVLGYGNTTEGILLGVNGIRIRDGYLYFTNSRLGTFSRVRIDDDGIPVRGGKVEVIAVLPGFEDGAHLWDDFDFDQEGNAYITAHPSSLIKVMKGGRQETLVGGDGDGPLSAPTAVAFGKGGKVFYVTSMVGKVLSVEV
jgi:hypothetical protein